MEFNHYLIPTVSFRLVSRVLANDIITGLPYSLLSAVNYSNSLLSGKKWTN